MFDLAKGISRRTILGLSVFGIVVVGVGGYLAFPTKAEIPPINMDANQVAIRGYDTVAYFTDGKATKGKPELEQVWQEARWRFASSTNRALFAANPERYAPAYGGYCSLGLAIGEYSDANPEAWTIVDGKLYLSKTKRVHAYWQKGPKAYIFAADHNWHKYRDQLRINDNLR